MTNMKVFNCIFMNKMAGELSRMNIIAENDFQYCRIALSLTLPSLGPFRLPQRWRRSKRETSISGDLLSDRAARLPGREVAFPALRATRTEREREGLGRVGRTNTRQITSFLPLLYDVDHEQAASLPSLCSPLSFCGHQVNEDADEEEGATERKTDGRTDKSDRRGKDLSCVLSLLYKETAKNL